MFDDDFGVHLVAATSNAGTQRFFQLKCFYETANKDKWALLHSLDATENYNEYLLPDSPSDHIMRVTPSLRRIAALHVLDFNFQMRPHGLSTRIFHNPSNKKFKLLSSRDGYPPHIG